MTFCLHFGTNEITQKETGNKKPGCDFYIQQYSEHAVYIAEEPSLTFSPLRIYSQFFRQLAQVKSNVACPKQIFFFSCAYYVA